MNMPSEATATTVLVLTSRRVARGAHGGSEGSGENASRGGVWPDKGRLTRCGCPPYVRQSAGYEATAARRGDAKRTTCTLTGRPRHGGQRRLRLPGDRGRGARLDRRRNS